jgi:hypothetical protein
VPPASSTILQKKSIKRKAKTPELVMLIATEEEEEKAKP